MKIQVVPVPGAGGKKQENNELCLCIKGVSGLRPVDLDMPHQVQQRPELQRRARTAR